MLYMVYFLKNFLFDLKSLYEYEGRLVLSMETNVIDEFASYYNLINNILIIVIINGARSILRVKCATASLRLPSPFVRFIIHCVILVRIYMRIKKVYEYIYKYM